MLLFDYKSYSQIGLLGVLFEFYDESDILIEAHNDIQSNSGYNYRECLIKKVYFYIKLLDDYKSIKTLIYISRIDQSSTVTINTRLINTTQSNRLCIKYIKYNSL